MGHGIVCRLGKGWIGSIFLLPPPVVVSCILTGGHSVLFLPLTVILTLFFLKAWLGLGSSYWFLEFGGLLILFIVRIDTGTSSYLAAFIRADCVQYVLGLELFPTVFALSANWELNRFYYLTLQLVTPWRHSSDSQIQANSFFFGNQTKPSIGFSWQL